MKAALALGAGVALVLDQPAAAQPQRPLGMALQQIQARDFEAPFSVVFSAVMTVLQDAGFRILSADKITGLITAQGSAEGKLTYNLLWGFGKKKETPILSAFIEERTADLTRARLNFVISTGKSRNILTDERPVSEPAAYRDVFEKIEKEIFVRQALAAPPPPAAPNAEADQQPAEQSPNSDKKVEQALQSPIEEMKPREWRQAAYAPRLSVAFVDAANIKRSGAVAQFWLSMHYQGDPDSDHFVGLREADCSNGSFKNLSVSYYMRDTLVRSVPRDEHVLTAKPGSVDAELVRTACGAVGFGKAFPDPNVAARLYFETANW